MDRPLTLADHVRPDAVILLSIITREQPLNSNPSPWYGIPGFEEKWLQQLHCLVRSIAIARKILASIVLISICYYTRENI